MSDPRLPSLARLRGPVPRIEPESNVAPLQQLPDDVAEMIRNFVLKSDDPGDICYNIAQYCKTNTSFAAQCRDDKLWEQACAVFGINKKMLKDKKFPFYGQTFKQIFSNLCHELHSTVRVTQFGSNVYERKRIFDADWRKEFLRGVQHGWTNKRMQLIRKTGSQTQGLQRLMNYWGIQGSEPGDWHDLDTAFYGAGSVEAMETELRKGANVDCVRMNLTILQRAARSNNIEVVKLLLKYGADVNFYSKKTVWPSSATTLNPQATRAPPLILAIKNGHLKVVKLLLENGADVDPKITSVPMRNVTPLISAIRNDHLEIFKTLLTYGADVNLWGPLIHASDGGNLEIVKILLSKGADVNYSYYGTTPLSAALKNNHTDCALLLIRDPQFNANATHKRRKGGGNVLDINLAIKMRNLPVIRALIPKMSRHRLDNPVWFLLDETAYKVTYKVIDRLPSFVEFKNNKIKMSDSPLIHAIQIGYSEAVRVLLEEGGIDPNAENSGQALRNAKFNKNNPGVAEVEPQEAEVIYNLLIQHGAKDLPAPGPDDSDL